MNANGPSSKTRSARAAMKSRDCSLVATSASPNRGPKSSSKMKSEKDELDQKRGVLIKRADALRDRKRLPRPRNTNVNFAATQQLQRAIAAAEAAQQVPR